MADPSKPKWKKIDPSMLDSAISDQPSDKPHHTAANNILPGISPERIIREIKGMLVDPEYFFAETTLRGILETVERTELVTQGQWDAIEKICENPRREGRHRRSRRF